MSQIFVDVFYNIFDFLKKYNINIEKSKINFQHVVLINWIKHLCEVRQISNFHDNYGNDYVYISKSFVKKQLPLLNVSINTETKLFNDLKDIGNTGKFKSRDYDVWQKSWFPACTNVFAFNK